MLNHCLSYAAEEASYVDSEQPVVKVADICGPTDQALEETELAVKYGYDSGLVSMGGLDEHIETDLLERPEKLQK